MFKSLTTILVLSCCQPALGQLTAGFAADKTGGCGPLVVHFSNLTSGAGATASWHVYGDPDGDKLGGLCGGGGGDGVV